MIQVYVRMTNNRCELLQLVCSRQMSAERVCWSVLMPVYQAFSRHAHLAFPRRAVSVDRFLPNARTCPAWKALRRGGTTRASSCVPALPKAEELLSRIPAASFWSGWPQQRVLESLSRAGLYTQDARNCSISAADAALLSRCLWRGSCFRRQEA